MIFPLSAMPWGVRWIGYLLPLTYFINISQGVMLRGAPLSTLWVSFVVLIGMAIVVLGVATLRFRRDLAPNVRSSDATRRPGGGHRVTFGASHGALRGVPRSRTSPLRYPADPVTVVGGDGAGKSTLLRAWSARSPGRGQVDPPAKQRLGYLPATSGTWGELTVTRTSTSLRASTACGRELTERRDELLARPGSPRRPVGCPPAFGRDAAKLGFVMAIVHRPDLLILDEPCTGVDPVSRIELWRLVAGRRAGAAVVMATTYLDEAERASTSWSSTAPGLPGSTTR